MPNNTGNRKSSQSGSGKKRVNTDLNGNFSKKSNLRKVGKRVYGESAVKNPVPGKEKNR